MKPVAWIENHKGGKNLEWEPINHPYAQATPLYAIPEGYKLVPVEPTEAMIQAYLDAQADYCHEMDLRGGVIFAKLACAAGLKAMIAAIEGEQ